MTASETSPTVSVPEIEALVEAVRDEAVRFSREHGCEGLDVLRQVAVSAMRAHSEKRTRWQQGVWR